MYSRDIKRTTLGLPARRSIQPSSAAAKLPVEIAHS